MYPVHYLLRTTPARLFAYVFVSVTFVSCLSDHNPAPAFCRLMSATESDELPEIWTYRADGQLASANGITYSYDSGGYVAQAIDKPGSSTTYEYTSGRLTSAIGLRTDGVRSVSTTMTYTYDSDGGLSRLVTTSRNGTQTLTETYLFQNGKQVDYMNSEAFHINRRPYTFENGLVKQSIAYNLRTGNAYVDQTYTYDVENRLIRVTYANGEYDTFDYTDGSSARSLLPTPKGWPVVALNSKGQTTSLLATKIAYRYDESNMLRKVGDISYTYTKTPNGFPLTMSSRYRTYNQAGTSTSEGNYTTALYTYARCQ
jgi:hypothetical protein